METRLRYLPITDATEGMILGAPVVLSEQGINSFKLPAGHALTETNIHQMALRHAEFICIEVPDERSPEEREAEWAVEEMRVNQIFRAADLNDPIMARLHAAVLNFRRS